MQTFRGLSFHVMVAHRAGLMTSCHSHQSTELEARPRDLFHSSNPLDCQYRLFDNHTTITTNHCILTMATRTSGRHAAHKAKEAMATAPDTKRRGSAGTKRKGSTEQASEPKKGRKRSDNKPGKANRKETQQPPEKVETAESESHRPLNIGSDPNLYRN